MALHFVCDLAYHFDQNHVKRFLDPSEKVLLSEMFKLTWEIRGKSSAYHVPILSRGFRADLMYVNVSLGHWKVYPGPREFLDRGRIQFMNEFAFVLRPVGPAQ